MRAALRYHGGKHQLAPWIISHFPKHRIYVEPFGGAMSVLLRKERCYAEIYNDLDGEIVNFFRVLRDQDSEFKRIIELTPFSREEFTKAYEETPDPLERARRTLVKSFMGFGSAAVTQKSPTLPGAGFKADVDKLPTGFRSNSNRSGTTHAHDWHNWPKRMHQLVERLQGVTIENKAAISVIQQQDSTGTLHYIDPPYVHSTRGLKKHRTPQSYKYEMTDAEHLALGQSLQNLAGMVIVSGYRCDLYDSIYKDWIRTEREAKADGARSRVECLWLSPSVTSKKQISLFHDEKQ